MDTNTFILLVLAIAIGVSWGTGRSIISDNTVDIFAYLFSKEAWMDNSPRPMKRVLDEERLTNEEKKYVKNIKRLTWSLFIIMIVAIIFGLFSPRNSFMQASLTIISFGSGIGYFVIAITQRKKLKLLPTKFQRE